MKSTLVPLIATPFSTPAATARVRADLNRASQELASGRLADVGLELAGKAGYLAELDARHEVLTGLKDDANIARGRLEVMQQSLEQAADGAQDFLKLLLPLKTGQGDAKLAREQAAGLLQQLTNLMNVSYQGAHVFGGRNISDLPLVDYFADPPSSARQAVENAFTARFGFPPTDPAVATITAADMKDFLANDLPPLFEPPQWQADFSTATDDAMRTPIGENDSVPSTASANDPAIRKLAMAYVMMAGLGTENLNAAARQEVVAAAIEATGEAIAGLDTMRSLIGVRQERVQKAVDNLDARIALMEKEVAGMEQVDLHEAAERVNALSLQLETSYRLSGRLQNLSLLKYM